MANIVITSAGKEIIIQVPIPEDKENWNVVQSEELGGDRKAFTLENFKLNFPGIELPSDETKALDLISKLGSRNTAVRDVLTKISITYATTANTPGWLKEHVAVSDMTIAEKEIAKINNLASSRQKEEEAALATFRKAKAAIAKKYEVLVGNARTNNIIKVLSLTSDQAPISVALAIENYSPADNEASTPNKRLYARELITAWKISLLKLIKESPECDVDKIVADMAPK